MTSYYKTAAIIGVGILETFIVMSLYVLPVQAETRVGGRILTDTVWSKQGSPYLLTESITVPDGVSLEIKAGITVGVAPEVEVESIEYAPGVFISGGAFSIEGSQEDRVSIRGISGIFVTSGPLANGSAHMEWVDFLDGSGVSFENSFGSIASSTISNAYMGVYAKDSIVSIWGSKIQNNSFGIYVQPHSIFQVRAGNAHPGFESFGVGGIGNALDGAEDLYASSSLTITGSSITGNTSRAIHNGSELTVAAAGNWWGEASGPGLSGMNSIRGKVQYAPWLLSEPAGEAPIADVPCCSSVLFIPGLEATRLYRPETTFLGGRLGRSTTINQLWEPNRNADVTKLFLNSSGSSTDPSIYSGGPIDKGLGVFDVYDSFMKLLDGLAAEGTIGEWKSFGYDWRKAINEVVTGSEKKATTTERLLQMVENLAAHSKTQKVSIVAHSNGGLVAKYLVKILNDQGKANLIDSVVSVAVPYLGTPAAITGLLHGDDQAIFGGLILSQATARTLGTNMPSAYSLLPSRAFFSNVFGPTIAFASTTIPGINNGAYPKSINSFDQQASFLADTANNRKSPQASNTKMPIKGNRLLLAASEVVHGLLDPFVWPATIARWTIVGWNANTTRGVTYLGKGYVSEKNPYGDGTVKTQSAAYGGGHVLPIDLSAASQVQGKDIIHANILESSSTKAVLNSILSIPSGKTAQVLQEVSTIPAVSVGDKDWNALDAAYDASRRELRVSTHSPVKLHVYDSAGNHTGEVPLPAAIAAQVEDGLYTMKEQKIPGSSYEVLGCVDEEAGDCDTQVTLLDGGQIYTVFVEGVGTGSFTLNIERIRGASTTEMVEWKAVPVTSLSVATTTVASSGADTPSVTLASSTSALSLDLNGDGAADATSSPNTSFDKRRSMELFRKFKWPQTDRGDRLRRFGQFILSNLSQTDKTRIMDEIAALLRKLER